VAETEVDQPVEEQTTAAEAALTMVIADAIMSQGDQSSDDSAFWTPILLGGPNLVLTQFLRHSTVIMWPEVAPPTIRRAVDTSADVVMRRAAEIVAEGVPEMREADPVQRAARVVTTAGRASRAAIVGGRESARFEVAKTVGAVYKVWRTRRDKRVRPTHGGLEGNRVPLNSEFITFEGNHLRFPRDPLAPLEETAECRCRLSYIIKD
jgi:hypothetical protein